VEVKNNREAPARIEIKRDLRHQYWELKPAGDYGSYEKEDLDTVKFSMELKPFEKKMFTYQVRCFEGERRQAK
jgi:hypothetical protein